MMSRKDYQMLAKALAASDTVEEATRRIADGCGEANPAFNRDLFIAVVTNNKKNTTKEES